MGSLERGFPKDHRSPFLADRPGPKPDSAINMLMKHGVRSCLDYAAHHDLAKARALSNPDNAPHLDFIDMGGHGYALVTVTAETLACDFVCIPRPLERAGDDGGPLRYRIRHEAALWPAGATPKLVQTVLEGDPGLSISRSLPVAPAGSPSFRQVGRGGQFAQGVGGWSG